MSNFYGANVSTNGLILHVDAANIKSAPSAGTWYDLAGYGSNLAMTGSPSLTTLAGAKCYQFTAGGQCFTGTLNAPQPATNLTIEAWVYPQTLTVSGDMSTILLMNGGQAAYMSIDKSTNQMANYWYSHPTTGYWETNGAMTLNSSWYYIACVWNAAAGMAYQWLNSSKTIASSTVGNAATGSGLNIGQESSGRQYAGGISVVRAYNRALTDNEILGNFNAQRKRFGV
jgi:hypothetical protein